MIESRVRRLGGGRGPCSRREERNSGRFEPTRLSEPRSCKQEAGRDSRCKQLGPSTLSHARRRTAAGDSEGPHRPGDVLDDLLAHVFEAHGQPVAHMVPDHAGDHDGARLRQLFKPRRDVHALAVDVVICDDHVAGVDADAEHNPKLGRQLEVPPLDAFVNLGRAANRFDHAWELGQKAVAGLLHESAAVVLDRRADQLLA